MNIDFISLLSNLSNSLLSVERLVTGFGYVLGLIFVIIALHKFHQTAGNGSLHGREGWFIPGAYLVGGAVLIFLPSAMDTLSATVFGVGNILEYGAYNSGTIYHSMGVLVRASGVIWFIRGCVLMIQASEHGTQHGPKGLMFLFAGILAINFDNTVYYVNWLINKIVSFFP